MSPPTEIHVYTRKLGFLSSIFIYLKGDVPLCSSCMFGTARRRQWRKKGKKLGSMRKETENNPGSEVSVDKLQSDQLGLVPQFLGKIKIAIIVSSNSWWKILVT